MKKVSAVSKRLYARRERKLLARLARRRSIVAKRWKTLPMKAAYTFKEFDPEKRRYFEVLKCPSKLNLSADYDTTIAFLNDVRVHANRRSVRLRVDLTPLQEITPAAALLVVAEFDRWRSKTRANKLTPVSLNQWNPSVRRRLKEMGFFEALGTTCFLDDDTDENEDHYLKFITGRGSDGDAIRKLRKGIEGLGPKLVDSGSLYDGVVEAMTNVQQHAYPKNQKIRRWWVSASVNVAKNKLRVMVVDHGSGITATIRRKGLGEHLRGAMEGFGGKFIKELLADDAELLEAAFSDDEVNRSQTGFTYRGKGLRQDIKGYVSEHNSSGWLRVFSNHGKYTYERSAGGVQNSYSDYIDRPFRGTFIEWTIEDYGDVEPSVHN